MNPLRLFILYFVATGLVATQPNILFILCDDLGYGDVGVFWQNERAQLNDPGVPHFGTPAIDTLARDGVMLTQHYCGAPVCAPSRASLLTGLTQGHASVRNNEFDKALTETLTLGSVLQEAGYATAAFGKWGLQGGGTVKDPAPDRPESARMADYAQWNGYPTKRGFDYFYGYVRHRDGHFHYPREDGREVWENEREVSPGLDLCYSTDLFAARTKQWIIDHQRTKPDQPFLAYLAYDTPHAVLHNPASAYPAGGGLEGGLQWLGQSGRMINTAQGGYDAFMHPAIAERTWDHDGDAATAQVPWPDVQKRYANLVRRIDDTVGDLLQTLADLGIADQTLVIFTSDNGPSKESYLEERYAPTFFDGFGPFAGIKRDNLEGGIREPTLARWPERIPGGRVDDTPSGHWDWLATFAEMAGLPRPAGSDGVSLQPSLTGEGARNPSIIYSEYERSGRGNGARTPSYAEFLPVHRGRIRGQMQSIILGDYKGLRYDIHSADDDFEIYALATDPREGVNLAPRPEYAGVQAMMKARVLQLRRSNASSPRPYDDALIPPATVHPPRRPGLIRETFAGSWPWMPDFGSLPPMDRETREALMVDDIEVHGNLGVMFAGYVEVPESGTYELSIKSSGSHLVFLHDARVVAESTGEQAASVHLMDRWHPLRVYLRSESAPLSLQVTLSDAAGRDILADPARLRH